MNFVPAPPGLTAYYSASGGHVVDLPVVGYRQYEDDNGTTKICAAVCLRTGYVLDVDDLDVSLPDYDRVSLLGVYPSGERPDLPGSG